MDGTPKKYKKGNVYAVSNDPNSCGRGLTDLKRAVFTLKDNNDNDNDNNNNNNNNNNKNRLNDVKSAISFSIWNTF